VAAAIKSMNYSLLKTSRAALCGFLLLVALPICIQGQERNSGQQSELIAAAREIMVKARYCALITRGPSGRAEARTLDAFPPDANFVVWLGTNPRSRKVKAIRQHSRVTLYYFDRDSEAYVTLYGIAHLVNDPAMKTQWWKEEWKTFYPDRAKDYLLIRVTPEKLEVVDVMKGIVGDSKTWKPPAVVFSNGKAND
jgi:general stress protein 26